MFNSYVKLPEGIDHVHSCSIDSWQEELKKKSYGFFHQKSPFPNCKPHNRGIRGPMGPKPRDIYSSSTGSSRRCLFACPTLEPHLWFMWHTSQSLQNLATRYQKRITMVNCLLSDVYNSYSIHLPFIFHIPFWVTIFHIRNYLYLYGGRLMRWISMAMNILYLYASLPDMAIPEQFALRTDGHASETEGDLEECFARFEKWWF